MNRRRKRCYAEALGECGGRSSEHIISAGLFSDDAVVATIGLPMPDGKPVGINSLVGNVLCSKHNSMLSLLDEEMKKVADACAAFRAAPTSAEVRASGPLIERWLLKVVAGTLSAGWIRGVRTYPPIDVVETLFGLRPLPANVFLCGVANIEGHTRREQAFSWDMLVEGSGSMGVIMMINGLPLFFSICLDDPQRSVRSIGSLRGFDLGSADVRPKPPEVCLGTNEVNVSLTIRLDWDR